MNLLRNSSKKAPSIALVYDRVNKYGGAERVLEALHQIWPNAPLYTSLYNPSTAKWAQKFNVIPSFINKIPWIRTKHEWLAWLMPFAFESLDLGSYDIVISVTSAEAKGIITSPKTLHLCYLLTPTRYLWSHTHWYANSRWRIITAFRRMVMSWLRQWDYVAAQRPDIYICISKTVARRLSKYYRKNPAQIIYPPMSPLKEAVFTDVTFDEPYYLVVSRLVSYKRVDLAIKACKQLDKRLVIVGEGVQKKDLQKIAGPKTVFLGEVTDERLSRLYTGCKGVIFAAEEDFGIVCVEAQAAGKGVIAYAKGGATEIIQNHTTGVFFDQHKVKSLVSSIKAYEKIEINQNTCKENAARFALARFQAEFQELVEVSWESHLKTRQ